MKSNDEFINCVLMRRIKNEEEKNPYKWTIVKIIPFFFSKLHHRVRFMTHLKDNVKRVSR